MNRYEKITIFLVLLSVLVLGAGLTAIAAEAEKILIRPKYADGQKIEYRLKLNGTLAWSPDPKRTDKVTANTDFTFVLSMNEILPNDGCRFDIVGEKIVASLKTADREFKVSANKDRANWEVYPRAGTSTHRNPVSLPSTTKLGPLGGFNFTAVGLSEPLAGTMLPMFDKRFFTLVTMAPKEEITVGQKWTSEIKFPLTGAKKSSEGTDKSNRRRPGRRGRKMEKPRQDQDKPARADDGTTLEINWHAVKWTTYGGKKCLLLTANGELPVKDQYVNIKNAGRVHVTEGIYKISAQIMWSVEKGIIYSATAKQQVAFKTDKPTPRSMSNEVTCSIQMLKLISEEKKQD